MGNCTVAFVRVALREGYPEVHPNNTLFSIVKSYGKLVDGTDGAALHSELKVEEGECVFTKRRVSAFSTTELACYCRAQGFTSLVIGGVSTSGVVLTTTREAWDMDLKITVLKDLCADEPEKHDALCDVIYPGMGTVTTAGEWVAGLKGARAQVLLQRVISLEMSGIRNVGMGHVAMGLKCFTAEDRREAHRGALSHVVSMCGLVGRR